MPRHDSPFIYGDYWLDKRRDGRSPHIWQIASGTRQVKYRSTGKSDVDEAKAVITGFVESLRAAQPQEPDSAKVVPLLFAYWHERGSRAVAPDQIASSIRAFMGFLFQDSITVNAVVTDLTPAVFERFRQWRMSPHEYDVPWAGRDYQHKSSGVRGETVQRNLDDVRAAINYAQDNRRLPYVPKVPSVESRYRSPPRDRILTLDELGRIVFYARHFDDLGRYVALLIGTAARPEAVAKFDPATQYDATSGIIDLHPADAPLTKKRNPKIPAIAPLRLVLSRWKDAKPVKSRRTAWRTMRRVMGLPDDIQPKTIRHTVATWIDECGVPERQIEMLLGHRRAHHAPQMKRATRHYVHRKSEMSAALAALSTFWLEASRAARRVGAVHLLSTSDKIGNRPIDNIALIRKDIRAFEDGGR